MQVHLANRYPALGAGMLFGTHSCLDKLSSGLSIIALQHLAQLSAGERTEDGRAGPEATLAYTVGACGLPLAASCAALALCCHPAVRPPLRSGSATQPLLGPKTDFRLSPSLLPLERGGQTATLPSEVEQSNPEVIFEADSPTSKGAVVVDDT